MNTPSTICERLEKLRDAYSDKLGANGELDNLCKGGNLCEAVGDYLEALDASAALPPPSPVARDGWVMVPREPTLGMFADAGLVNGYAGKRADHDHFKWWSAMLAICAAAPQAHAGEVTSQMASKVLREYEAQRNYHGLVALPAILAALKAVFANGVTDPSPAPASVSVEAVRAITLFIDCEWNSYQGDLISIALVPADDKLPGLYVSLGCDNPDPWVAEHVMPHIAGMPRQTYAELQVELGAYLREIQQRGPVEIVADWPEEIERFCRLLVTGPGTRVDCAVPSFRVISIDAPSKVPHDALHDAMGLRDTILAALDQQENTGG